MLLRLGKWHILLFLFSLSNIAFAGERYAVFDFKGPLEFDHLQQLTDEVRLGASSVIKSKDIIVLDRENIIEIVGWENLTQSSGASSALKSAKVMKIQHLVLGDVKKKNSFYHLQLRLYNTETGQMVLNLTEKSKSLVGLMKTAKGLGRRITTKGLGLSGATDENLSDRLSDLQTLKAERAALEEEIEAQ